MSSRTMLNTGRIRFNRTTGYVGAEFPRIMRMTRREDLNLDLSPLVLRPFHLHQTPSTHESGDHGGIVSRLRAYWAWMRRKL